MCRCGSPLMNETQAMLDDVKVLLEAHDGNLLSLVVDSLEQDFEARITEIAHDQWSMVAADRYDQSFSTRIECDRVEDGIAATWRAFADRYGVPKGLTE